MKKKIILFVAGFLLVLDFFVWKEVFVLAEPRYLEVDFLDVGQGDAAFIETSQGHQIIIDGGPSSALLQKLSERMPFWDKTIDVVILSHPEKDHMTGILDLLKTYRVDYFLWTGVVKDDAENKELASLLDKAGKPRKSFLAALAGDKSSTKVIFAESGQEIKAGDLKIDVLFPQESLAGKQVRSSTNNNTVVGKLIYGENSFLFVGDISSAAEKKLANSNENIASDVLKVAHHGSKYSTSDLFLQTVNPKYAVISVGAKNTYGHPTPEVLQRLANYGIKVKRTDTDGDIEFVSDGKNIIIARQ